MNKKDSKLITILLVLIMLSVITMSFGIINNYYMKKNNAENEVEIVVKNVNLLMSYDTNSKIVFKGLNNGLDYNYSFSVSNDSPDYSVGYKLNLNIENNNEESEEFTYSLSGNILYQNSEDKLITINNDIVPTTNTVLGSGYISGSQVHYYVLNIKYNGENMNEKLFMANISIEKSME